MTSPTLEAPGLRTAVAEAHRPGVVSFPSILDTNPYQRLLYEQLAAHGFRVEPAGEFRVRWLLQARRSVDLLHFHWPQGYWRANDRRRVSGPVARWAYLALFATRIATAKALGYDIAWTIHQVHPHDGAPSRVDRIGARVLARASSVLIAHDAATAASARAELGRAARDVTVVPHGSYLGVYEPGRSRPEVRGELGIAGDRFVFLHLGDMRAYKDLAVLIAAFRSTDLPDATLVVAGTPADRDTEASLRDAAAGDPRIVLRFGFVPEVEVAELYNAADAAVVARGDGGTSGSLILALSMGKAVVAADRPSYRSLIGVDAAGWLFAPGDPDSLRYALERTRRTTPAELRAKCRVALARAERLDWTEIGGRTAELFLEATRREAA
jgi:beta-1,4-mannosyltransferase